MGISTFNAFWSKPPFYLKPQMQQFEVPIAMDGTNLE
jgi:hypothetical protein